MDKKRWKAAKTNPPSLRSRADRAGGNKDKKKGDNLEIV
jgi:hypothetical protein